MKYIIYGAGETGIWALYLLGWNRVACFADNKKAGGMNERKKIVSYNEMYRIYQDEKNIIVVIASEKYWKEMLDQVNRDGLKRNFVFHKEDVKELSTFFPSYMLYKQQIDMPYVKILAQYDISKYKKIGIYGVNKYLHYLIAEVMIQSPYAEVIILTDEEIPCSGYVGCEVRNFELCRDELECLIINVKHCEDLIREKLDEINYNFDVIDLYDVEKFESSFYHGELAVYKDIHKGRRIFVIGNGPSLTIEDLNRLHEKSEICIGVNKIYRVYDKTPWRADYLGITDWRGIQFCRDEIFQVEGKIFLGDNTFHCEICDFIPDAQYFHLRTEEFMPNYARFSNDFTKGFYGGATVTYDFSIQLAAYMGAKEIYLLGVDNNISLSSNWKKSHFIENYYTDNEVEMFELMGITAASFETEKVIKQYQTAEKYSRKHGFRIFNATRGGNLEVFQRVNFDNLF